MSLQQWLNNGWLRPHQTDAQEIANLLAIADRDIADAGNATLSADWRFGIAYNAALKLCTMLLFAAGYRPENTLAHYRTLLSLEYNAMAEPICLKLERQLISLPFSLALFSAGSSIPARIAIIAITTRSSIKVNILFILNSFHTLYGVITIILDDSGSLRKRGWVTALRRRRGTMICVGNLRSSEVISSVT